MSTLNAQELYDWYPKNLTGLSYDINKSTLSKPFCSHSENAILFQTGYDEVDNPNFDATDLNTTTYEVSYLFVIVSMGYGFSFEDFTTLEEVSEWYDFSSEFLGYKDLSMYSAPYHTYFFKITEFVKLPNNYQWFPLGGRSFSTNIIQNTLNFTTAAATDIFWFNSGSMEGFDLNEFTRDDLYDLNSLGGIGRDFNSKQHILVDGSTNPENLSDFIYESYFPPVGPPLKLAHPDVACLKEDGKGMDFNLMVEGDVVIDVDYCFSNDASQAHSNPEVWPSESSTPNYRYIYMGPDARLIIESGVEFTLHRTIVTSCDVLWNSIVVQDGATLNIRDSYIRDGIKAIYVEPGGTLNIDGTIFDANKYAIYTPPSTDGSQYEITVGPFYGNEFINYNELKAFPDGYNGVETEGPVAGIKLNDVKQFIAHGVGQSGEVHRNVFDGMPFGIWAENSGLYLQNYQIFDAFNVEWYGGFGISLVNRNFGTRSEIIGSGSPQHPNIYNAEYGGIFVNNGLNIIRDNIIGEVPMGVRVLNSTTSLNNISFNEISASLYGIVQPLERGGINRIVENKIVMNSDVPFTSSQYTDVIGIYLAGLGISGGIQVIDNDILMGENARIGLNVQSINVARIRGNDVFGSMDNFEALDMRNSPRSLVDFNSFEGVNSTHSRGVYIYDSPTSRINCNDLTDVEYGINIYHENTGAEIKGNNFLGNSAISLVYGTPGISGLFNPTHITGEQFHHGNLWLANSTIGAWHSNQEQIAELSLFTVNPIANPNYTTSRNPIAWFLEDLDGVAWECPTERPENFGYDIEPKKEPTELDQRIAIGDRPFEGHKFEESLTYIAKRSLYDRIMEGYYDANALASPELSAFIDYADTTNIGLFYNVLETIRHTVNLPNSVVEQIELKSAEIGHSIRSLITLDSIAWLDTANVDTTQWQMDRVLLLETIHEKSDELNQIYESYAGEIGNPAQSLIASLSGVSTPTLPEYAERHILLIMLNHVFSGDFDFTSNEQNKIIEIADFCPAVAGPSVHWARNMRNIFESGISYDDTNCSPGSALRRVNPDEKEEGIVELFPNPVSDRLNVSMNSNTYNSFEIIDQMGRLIMEGHVEQDVELFGIEVNTLTQGQYILRLKGDEGDTNHQFIRVQR